MGVAKVTIEIDADDQRLPEILKILQKERGMATPGRDARGGPRVPRDIALLQEYEKRGGKAGWAEARIINARVYMDPRGAGGMYSKVAGYIRWDEDAQKYFMTEKARKRLEAWRRQGRSGRQARAARVSG